jgi:CRAL/TRIO domain
MAVDDTLLDSEGVSMIEPDLTIARSRARNKTMSFFDPGAIAWDEEQVPDDPTTMNLAPQELARAQEIKRAVEANSEVENLTDFEFVQFALAFGEEPMDQIVGKIAMHHAFRRQYGVRETVNDGVKSITRFSVQHYGVFLCIKYLKATRSYVTVMDWAAMIPPQKEEQYQVYFSGLYYILHACFPDFESIRKGLTMVVECEGATSKNVSQRHIERVASDFHSHYPKKQKEVYFVNSPSVVNVACSLLFRLVGKNMRENIKLGYQIQGWEGRRIDVLYKSPSPEGGRINMLGSSRDFIEKRYRNIARFRLPAPTH